MDQRGLAEDDHRKPLEHIDGKTVLSKPLEDLVVPLNKGCHGRQCENEQDGADSVRVDADKVPPKHEADGQQDGPRYPCQKPRTVHPLFQEGEPDSCRKYGQRIIPPMVGPSRQEQEQPKTGCKHADGNGQEQIRPGGPVLQQERDISNQVQRKDGEDEPGGISQILPADPAEQVLTGFEMISRHGLDDEEKKDGQIEMEQGFQEPFLEEPSGIPRFEAGGFGNPETRIEEIGGDDQLVQIAHRETEGAVRNAITQADVLLKMGQQDEDGENAFDGRRRLNGHIVPVEGRELHSIETDDQQQDEV